ncbi:unnamed protein product [Paramecium sonneborni]|uniref:Radial spoke head protein 9 homolog n=1 Tax=Paramecium sonneborni TaxID=65129 RepID=A0A8S1RME2_9CILI|nr:unnamed protein product [Paramecium sonneborni]
MEERVEGVEKDYSISLGIQYKGQYEFPLKKFFWRLQLQLLNILIIIIWLNCLNIMKNIHKELKIQESHLQVNMNISYLKLKKKLILRTLQKYLQLPAKNFSELERLSYTVQQIEFQCASMPVGSYRLTPTHELIKKPFTGIKAELKNYQHFRTPTREDKQDLITRDEALYRKDFFDCLVEDTPSQQWSLQADSTQRNITLSILIWPGYITYSNDYSFEYAYFGDGIKNLDFEFFL